MNRTRNIVLWMPLQLLMMVPSCLFCCTFYFFRNSVQFCIIPYPRHVDDLRSMKCTSKAKELLARYSHIFITIIFLVPRLYTFFVLCQMGIQYFYAEKVFIYGLKPNQIDLSLLGMIRKELIFNTDSFESPSSQSKPTYVGLLEPILFPQAYSKSLLLIDMVDGKDDHWTMKILKQKYIIFIWKK